VSSILEGSVRRAQNKIRIVAQLIDADTENHLWAETYDRDYADIFSIQSDVAEKIATALEATLTSEEKQYLEVKPTSNMKAYDYFLKGNYYWHTKTSKEGNLKAVEMYDKAIELDPNFALAYARVSITHSIIYSELWDPSENRLQLAKATLDKATTLDPDHPEVHFARGVYYYDCLQDNNNALKEYRIAFQGQPNNSEIAGNIGFTYAEIGDWNAAEEYLLKAYELNPHGLHNALYIAGSYLYLRNFAKVEYYINIAINNNPERAFPYRVKALNYIVGYGDLEKARQSLEEGLKNLTPSSLSDIRFLVEIYSRNYNRALEIANAYHIQKSKSLWKGTAYYYLKEDRAARSEFDSARVIYEQLVEDEPLNYQYHSSLGLVYAYLQMKEEAVREGKVAVEILPISKIPDGTRMVWNLGCIYVLVEEFDLAIDQFELLLSIPSQYTKWSLKLNPLLNILHDHPRFQNLIGERQQ
jgi:tetratricopeptide (TPR) repeat protein